MVPPALRELGVEGVIVDQTLPAGGAAAEHLGLPFSHCLFGADVE